MSHSHSHSTGSDGQTHVGNDEMNLKKIVAVGVVALIVFAVGIVAAYFLWVGQIADVRKDGAEKPRAELGKSEIGIVDQALFSDDNRLDVWRAEHKKRLETYGWIDKAKGIAHMPIEQAMAKVIASPPDIAGEGVPPSNVAPPSAPPEFNGQDAAKSAAAAPKPAPEKAKGTKR